MDYKKVSIALIVIIVIMAVAFSAYLISTGTTDHREGEGIDDDTDHDDMDDVFGEPPGDFEPPPLPT